VIGTPIAIVFRYGLLYWLLGGIVSSKAQGEVGFWQTGKQREGL